MAHYKQLFLSKGNYEEGFGEEKITSRRNEREALDDDNRSSTDDEESESFKEVVDEEKFVPVKAERRSKLEYLAAEEDDKTDFLITENSSD